MQCDLLWTVDTFCNDSFVGMIVTDFCRSLQMKDTFSFSSCLLWTGCRFLSRNIFGSIDICMLKVYMSWRGTRRCWMSIRMYVSCSISNGLSVGVLHGYWLKVVSFCWLLCSRLFKGHAAHNKCLNATFICPWRLAFLLAVFLIVMISGSRRSCQILNIYFCVSGSFV